MEKEGIIKDLIVKPLKEINIDVDSVTFTKEGNMNILRITIDKEPYVDVDDCVAATRIINPIIDKVDVTDDTYILDVCSKEKGGDK
jgi:ribosome maturation factor RimP